MTVHEILTKALALIATPEQWTTGAYARDADGNDCDEYTDRPVRLCAIGAIRRAHKDGLTDAEEAAVARALCRAADIENPRDPAAAVIRYNDEEDGALTTASWTERHARVVTMFRRAIEAEPQS